MFSKNYSKKQNNTYKRVLMSPTRRKKSPIYKVFQNLFKDWKLKGHFKLPVFAEIISPVGRA
jgi:hypothetical protein